MHHPPLRIVWTADLTYWIAGQPPRLMTERGWDTEIGHLQLCRDLGILPYYWYENFWSGELHSDQVTIHEETYPNGLQRKTWHTPVGELTEESHYQPESFSQAITRYPVQDADDLKILRHMLEHSQAVPTHLDTYPNRRKAWAEFDGLPSLAMPRSPLPAFLTEWAGVERGIYLLMDEPELARAVLDQLERLEDPVLDGLTRLARQIAPDPLLVHFADNLTSEVYTTFFASHMAGRYERRLERLHRAGIRCAVHLDGTVRGLLPRLAAVGMDAIEALTPWPAGDVSVEDMRRLAGNSSVILWGGLPGAMFAPPFTWEDLQHQIERTLKVWGGTPFILGTADQVPPNGDIDFVHRISEMIAERQE
jgi:hypothetical protein